MPSCTANILFLSWEKSRRNFRHTEETLEPAEPKGSSEGVKVPFFVEHWHRLSAREK